MGAAASGAGTWSAGCEAILQAVSADGVDTSTLQLFDGSGLGRADYVTSDQTTKLLDAVRSKPWFDTWYDSLPIAGNPDQLVGGTLRHRMAGTAAANNLHGKTGSMTGVSALSGYVTDQAGHLLVFSMMSNNFVEGGITPLEDQVGVRLANYDG
jgi:D-alanyl-D-alanine carboxypeptidase/D-alanyl-D-alanine-endopeptidase (penicillin-binding protein 4)